MNRSNTRRPGVVNSMHSRVQAPVRNLSMNPAMRRPMSRGSFLRGAGAAAIAGAAAMAGRRGIVTPVTATPPAGAIVVNPSMTVAQIQNAVDGKDPLTGAPVPGWSGVVYFNPGTYNMGTYTFNGSYNEYTNPPLMIRNGVTLMGPAPTDTAPDQSTNPLGKDWSGGAILKGVGSIANAAGVPASSPRYPWHTVSTIWVSCINETGLDPTSFRYTDGADHSNDQVVIRNLFIDDTDVMYNGAFASTHYCLIHVGPNPKYLCRDSFELALRTEWVEGGNLTVDAVKMIGGSRFHASGIVGLGGHDILFTDSELFSGKDGSVKQYGTLIVLLTNPNKLEVNGCYLRQNHYNYGGPSTTGPLYVSYMYGPSGALDSDCWIRLIGNTFETTYWGPTFLLHAARPYIVGNTFKSNLYGIYWDFWGNKMGGRITNNTLEMSNFNGFGYSGYAIYLNWCFAMNISDNTITGEALSAIYLAANAANTISNNDSTGFFGLLYQLGMRPGGYYCVYNTVQNNRFGPVDPAGSVVFVEGNKNLIGGSGPGQQNDYTNTDAPGWQANMDSKTIDSGCVLLLRNTSGNVVQETLFPAGTSVCTQVADLSMTSASGLGSNTVAGLESCNLQAYFQMVQKLLQLFAFLYRKNALEGEAPFGLDMQAIRTWWYDK